MARINVARLVAEIAAAGLSDSVAKIDAEGSLTFDLGATPEHKAAVLAVLDTHDPTPSRADACAAALAELGASSDPVARAAHALVALLGNKAPESAKALAASSAAQLLAAYATKE